MEILRTTISIYETLGRLGLERKLSTPVVLRFFYFMNLSLSGLPKHKEGTKCPSCHSTDTGKGGILIIRNSKSTAKKTYLGCSKYPECKYISPVKVNLPGQYIKRAAYQSNVNSRPLFEMVGKSGRVIYRNKPDRYKYSK